MSDADRDVRAELEDVAADDDALAQARELLDRGARFEAVTVAIGIVGLVIVATAVAFYDPRAAGLLIGGALLALAGWRTYVRAQELPRERARVLEIAQARSVERNRKAAG